MKVNKWMGDDQTGNCDQKGYFIKGETVTKSETAIKSAMNTNATPLSLSTEASRAGMKH